MLVAALPVMTASDPLRTSVKIDAERLVDRVGQHERAADHRDAEDDRDHRQDRPQLAAEHPSERDAGHCEISVIVARISLAPLCAELADDHAVGQEEDAVGDRRPRSRRASPSPSSARAPSAETCSILRISPPVFESRLPVGSSAKTTLGRETSARAIATRCCWPPESSDGRCSLPVGQADAVEQVREERRIGLLACDRERQQDVLLGRQHRQQVEELEHEADVLRGAAS